MKAIKTQYFGPGNVRGSRFKASDGDGNSVTVSYDYALNSEQNHARAAKALCKKMGWKGRLVGGSLADCYAWVFTTNGSPMVTV